MPTGADQTFNPLLMKMNGRNYAFDSDGCPIPPCSQITEVTHQHASIRLPLGLLFPLC